LGYMESKWKKMGGNDILWDVKWLGMFGMDFRLFFVIFCNLWRKRKKKRIGRIFWDIWESQWKKMGENEILWDVKWLRMFGMDFRLEKMMMICVFCYFF